VRLTIVYYPPGVGNFPTGPLARSAGADTPAKLQLPD
jgi:hypothetical protein